MACKETRTHLMAFADFDPFQHQAKCGCGFTTKRNECMATVLKELGTHRDADGAHAAIARAEGRP